MRNVKSQTAPEIRLQNRLEGDILSNTRPARPTSPQPAMPRLHSPTHDTIGTLPTPTYTLDSPPHPSRGVLGANASTLNAFYRNSFCYFLNSHT